MTLPRNGTHSQCALSAALEKQLLTPLVQKFAGTLTLTKCHERGSRTRYVGMPKIHVRVVSCEETEITCAEDLARMIVSRFHEEHAVDRKLVSIRTIGGDGWVINSVSDDMLLGLLQSNRLGRERLQYEGP